jgi:hypothetical protein
LMDLAGGIAGSDVMLLTCLPSDAHEFLRS